MTFEKTLLKSLDFIEIKNFDNEKIIFFNFMARTNIDFSYQTILRMHHPH